MKAALVNSENIVKNTIVWDETCTAPEGLTPIILEDDGYVSRDWVWKGGTTFEDPNPAPAIENVSELTPQEKLAQAGLTVDDLKMLLGLQ